MLEVCTRREIAAGRACRPGRASAPQIERLFAELSGQGFRTLGVAYRDVGGDPASQQGPRVGDDLPGPAGLSTTRPSRGSPRPSPTLARPRHRLKLITGDNRLVAAHVAPAGGDRRAPVTLTGAELRQMSDEALLPAGRRGRTSSPRSSRTRRSASSWPCGRPGTSSATWATGSTTPRPCTPPTSDLGRRRRGRGQGGGRLRAAGEGPGRSGAKASARAGATFANTLKYIFMATSANFGNMFSMAGGLAVPALPAAAAQADPAEQLPVRPAGDDHRHRPGGPGDGGPARAAGTSRFIRRLHDRLRR